MAYYQQPGQPGYPQPGYQQPAQQPGMVVMQGQSKPPPNVFGVTESVTINCPSCNAHVPTRTKCEISGTQWIICIILCIIGCPCPCIPCYIPSCYKVNHACSSCNHFIGSSQ
uniref:LITAF domain-containing protein n=1 Tax=Euplotes harpa TaxID=151035 RepID=A0A7S3J1M5_9SPIT